MNSLSCFVQDIRKNVILRKFPAFWIYRNYLRILREYACKNNETEDGIDELFRSDNKINSLKGVVP